MGHISPPTHKKAYNKWPQHYSTGFPEMGYGDDKVAGSQIQIARRRERRMESAIGGAKKQLDIYLQENWISSVGRKHTDFWTEDIYMTFLLGIF